MTESQGEIRDKGLTYVYIWLRSVDLSAAKIEEGISAEGVRLGVPLSHEIEMVKHVKHEEFFGIHMEKRLMFRSGIDSGSARLNVKSFLDMLQMPPGTDHETARQWISSEEGVKWKGESECALQMIAIWL